MTRHDGCTENEMGSDDWVAVCSCGFQSPAFKNERQAADALIAHYEAQSPKGGGS